MSLNYWLQAKLIENSKNSEILFYKVKKIKPLIKLNSFSWAL